MNEQIGWRGFVDRFRAEVPRYGHFLPQLPRLLHQALSAHAAPPKTENAELLKRVLAEQKRTNLLLGIAIYFGGGLLGGVLLMQFFLRWYYLFE